MKNIAPAISAPAGIGADKPKNQAVLDWVHEVELLAKPENIFWCDGSDREHDFLLDQATRQSVLIKLNQKKVPRSYLHRSNPNDVARVEQFTFICIVLLAGVWAAFIPPAVAQHEHPAGDPGKLGKVSFPVFQFDAFPGKSVLLEL